MAKAKRIDPKAFFTPEEWAGLTRRSSWRGLALVAHAWGTIFAAAALAVVWPNPLTWVLAVMIIGARQLGLAILMHDAAHGALTPGRPKLNDWLAEWLCAAPVAASLSRYRPYHLTHHRYAQQAEDPDLTLSAPFPTTRRSLRRKIVRDLTGQTFYKQRVAPLVAVLLRRKGPDLPLGAVFRGGSILSPAFLGSNAVLLGIAVAAGAWWAYPLFWLLPMATWFPLVTRLRNIAEHAVVPDNDDPLRHARTTKASWWERLLIAPYYVNYHVEHHMFMHLPCWRLPEAHRLLERKGVLGRMEVQPGYLHVLAMASARPERAAA
jgi:fatty acid desaturase